MPIEIAGLKVYSIPEISKMLNISPLTLRNYLRSGRIKGTKLARKWYVTEENLKELFNTTVKIGEEELQTKYLSNDLGIHALKEIIKSGKTIVVITSQGEKPLIDYVSEEIRIKLGLHK